MLGRGVKKRFFWGGNATYNVFDIPARKMQVGEFPEVIWEGQVPSPLVEVSRFGNQIYSQVHHGGWSSIPIQRQQSVAGDELKVCQGEICIFWFDWDTIQFSWRHNGSQDNIPIADCFTLKTLSVCEGKPCREFEMIRNPIVNSCQILILSKEKRL